MKMTINDLKPGLVPAQTIFSDSGIALISDGVPLTEATIERLKRLNIREISVCESAAVLPNKDTWNAEANPVFQFINVEKPGERIQTILYAALEHKGIQEFLSQINKRQRLQQHSMRTAVLSVGMGLQKGLDDNELETIAIAAFLHDFGSESNQSNDKAHTMQGFKKLWQAKADIIPCLVCLQHHEHVDGTGEPLGLKRTEIHEVARMVAIADYYDKLVNFADNTPKQAVFKVFAGRGSLFDSDSVKLFENIILKGLLFKPLSG